MALIGFRHQLKCLIFFSYVVNRLEPYTPYEFLVVPFYRGLSGQPSALYKAMTLEAKPVEAPTQLAWFQVNVSSVDILWKPISLHAFRGKPLGYQVRKIPQVLLFDIFKLVSA